MSIRVIDDLSCIRVINNNEPFIIHKKLVKSIDLLHSDTIRIDIGEGVLRHVYIKYTDVTEPVAANAGALRDLIKQMLDATETGQQSALASQQAQTNLLTDLKTGQLSIISILTDLLSATLGVQLATQNIANQYSDGLMLQIANTLTDIKTFLDPAYQHPITIAERLQFVGAIGQTQYPLMSDENYDIINGKLINARQILVFNQAGFMQDGIAADEYLFDNNAGIITFGQAITDQDITIIILK
jgi:hypothetical protein